jgi:hypothetical protein
MSAFSFMDQALSLLCPLWVKMKQQECPGHRLLVGRVVLQDLDADVVRPFNKRKLELAAE